jgi:4-oxalocrotonate tautomerase
MPLIEIKVFEDEFSDEQRAGIIEAVTDAMVSFTGESIRPHTWVVLEEVKERQLGDRRKRSGPARRARAAGASTRRPHVPAGRALKARRRRRGPPRGGDHELRRSTAPATFPTASRPTASRARYASSDDARQR